MKMKRLLTGVATGALLSAYLAPAAMAAYNAPFTIGAFTGDMTTAAGSYATTVSKFNGGTSFGSMAGQAASGVAITGGTVDGTAIGATTPSTAKVTTLSASGAATVASLTTSGNGAISAGTGAVSGGAGTFSGPLTSVGQIVAYRSFTGTGGTSLVATDQFVCINKTTGSATAVSQTALTVGQIYHLKDCKGDAATNNITYTPGSGITVDGSASYVMTQAYQEVNLLVTSATTVSLF